MIYKKAAVAYESFSLRTELNKSEFKEDFTVLVVTSANLLWKWSQGELRL